MYLDIGNNTLIDEKEIIAVVNVSDRFFTDFKKDDLDYTKNVEFVNEDESITITVSYTHLTLPTTERV